MADSIERFIGRQLVLKAPHPWAGYRARVVGWDKHFGLRVALMCGDAMDGHEAFVSSASQYSAVPKHLETTH